MKLHLLILTLILSIGIAQAEPIIGSSHLGHHPNAEKFITIYADEQVEELTLVNEENQFTLPLQRVQDSQGQNINCQGDVFCKRADLTQITTPGTYQIHTNNQTNRTITISEDVYVEAMPILMEYFNAHLMHNSSYHAQYFANREIMFPYMADGAVLFNANQASIAIDRLSNAYRVSPTLFTDKYDTYEQGQTDLVEHILLHVDYLRALQAYNQPADEYTVIEGWMARWGNFKQTPPEVPWYDGNQQPNFPSLSLDTSAEQQAQAMFAYTQAAPIVYEYDQQRGEELVEHTIAMHNWQKNNFPSTYTSSDAAPYAGAALFALYDLTGNYQYLEEAYFIREDVSTQLLSDRTRGEEFYWEQYILHQEEIEFANLSYDIEGVGPEEIFTGKLWYDWKDRGQYSMNQNAEHVYEFDRNIQFMNTRYALLEAMFAAKSERLGIAPPMASTIADNHLAWLTGMNAVQIYENNNELESRSFVLGIGNDDYRMMTRMLAKSLQGDHAWMTGTDIIPGWINGPYDYSNDADIIMNYRTQGQPYRHTESSNELVALAVELVALRDANFNHRAAMRIPIIIDQTTLPTPRDPPVEEEEPPTQNACYTLLNATATCNGGEITLDINAGCRQLRCENGDETLNALACPKAFGFEMYRQASNANQLEVCLGQTCIANNGYAKYEEDLYCSQEEPQPVCGDGEINQESEQCDGTAPDGYTCSNTCQLEQDAPPTPDEPVCASSVASIEATCSGGEIIQDNMGGCRSITCANGEEQLAILACDKPNTQQAEYFEMYKQSSNTNNIEICLANTCISNNGYAQSNQYTCEEEEPQPYCGDDTINQESEECDGSAPQGYTCSNTCQLEEIPPPPEIEEMQVSIAPWFPQERNYIFICETPFEATRVDWDFGDGQSQPYSSRADVWHTYQQAGNYTVTCQAYGLGSVGQSQLDITVE